MHESFSSLHYKNRMSEIRKRYGMDSLHLIGFEPKKESTVADVQRAQWKQDRKEWNTAVGFVEHQGETKMMAMDIAKRH